MRKRTVERHSFLKTIRNTGAHERGGVGRRGGGNTPTKQIYRGEENKKRWREERIRKERLIGIFGGLTVDEKGL